MIFDIADGKIEGVNWRKMKRIMRKKFVIPVDEFAVGWCYGINHYEFMFVGHARITDNMIFSISSVLSRWRKMDIKSYKRYRKLFSHRKITRWYFDLQHEVKNVYQVFDNEKDYIKWKLSH